jgi:hypothetical protein
MLPGPFYLNDVLVAPDLVQSLLSVQRFTTYNSCSMKFDPFGLSVKDLATRRVLTRDDSTGPLYTLAPVRSTLYLFLLCPPLLHVLPRTPWLPLLPSPPFIAALATPCEGRDDSLCHACQLGRHVRLPFPSSSTRALQPCDLVHCDL